MWINLHRAGAALLLFLVGLQALIAGQHIFGDWGITIHGIVGNMVFTVAVVIAAIAIFKLDSRVLTIAGVLMVVLISSQIGLGYSARDSDPAAALHIPLGVATFGALTYQLLASWPRLIAGSSVQVESSSEA